MRTRNVQKLAVGSMLSALVLLLTFFIKIPVPATGGYIHPGDGAILFAGLLMGPYAALIGGVGSALADVFGGYFIYIAPTFVLKGLMGWLAGSFAVRGRYVRNTLVFLLAALVMVVGYFLFEGFVYGWPAALAAVGPNAVQGLAAVLIGNLLSALPLRRLG